MIDNKNQYPFCNKIFETARKRACHQRLCDLNPNKDILLEKLRKGGINSGKRPRPHIKSIKLHYKCNCQKCNALYEVECTEYDYIHNRFKKYCSLKCANSHIITDEQKERILRSLIE